MSVTENEAVEAGADMAALSEAIQQVGVDLIEALRQLGPVAAAAVAAMTITEGGDRAQG